MSMNLEKSFGTEGNKHRMVNADLAGGALLDLGIYALTWIFQSLYHTQPAESRKAPAVLAAMKKYPPTGVDEMTTMLLTFPRSAEQGGDAHGIATTSMRCAADPDEKGSAGPAVRIYGEKGEIQVFAPIYRPTKTKIVLSDGTVEEKEWKQPGPGKNSNWKNGFGSVTNDDGEGHGMFWEADEAAFAFIEGRKNGGRYLDLEESILIMETMDEVRRQGGLVYPEAIESTDFPLEF